jgi:phosphoglycolate phosphatase
MIDQIDGIIWDWNGTLLNDAGLAVRIMNQMLEKRGLPMLSFEEYKSVFTFPVKDYYLKIGFDFRTEPFEIPALEFIDGYNSHVHSCELHRDTLKVLSFFRSIGVKQYILSAMEQVVLNNCLKHYQIDDLFNYVSGLDNIYAASKIENGHRLITELKLDAGKIVLIGDTVHDFEVAKELGCQCVLIANGHQSKEILQATGVLVVDQIAQLLDLE